MTDQLEQDIARGIKAQQILNDQLVIDAFQAVKDEVYKQWQSSPARDAEGREKLFLMLKAQERVEAHLRSVMETGQLADATLRQKLARLAGRSSVAF